MRRIYEYLHIATLDRYIIGKYLSAFFFSVLLFSLISMAIDFSDKVQIFIERNCTLKNVLFDYYPGFVLHITGLLLPLYVLIATVFFTSRMAFNAEILSILNAGVGFARLLRPYLIACGMIMVLHLALSHFVIPKANKARLLFERTFVWTDKQQVKNNNIHFFVSPNVKAYLRGYDKGSKRITTLRLEQYAGSRLVSLMEADNADWIDSTKTWRMNRYWVREFDGLKERYQFYDTPKDTALNAEPNDFISYHNSNEEMTTGELMAAIRKEEKRGFANTRTFAIEVHRRTADAFTGLILTVIGLAVAGRKARGGMGFHLAIGIGLGALFILLSKFSVTFAASGSIPVMLGMWIPNIMFAGVALALASRAQK